MSVGLVACAAQKRSEASPAGELYISPLFRKASTYCQATYERWFILSAKYGLVRPDAVLEPYDETLNRMPVLQRLMWASRVRAQLLTEGLDQAMLYYHAGQRYREQLPPGHLPLAGLGIGQQLAWYKARGF